MPCWESCCNPLRWSWKWDESRRCCIVTTLYVLPKWSGCRLQQVAVALTSWICLVWQIEVRVQHFCLQIQTRPQVSQLQAAPIRGGDGWRHESSAVKSPLKSVVFRCWFPFCLLALWQFRTPQACAELTDCVCLSVCCGKECPDPACWNRKSFCKTGASYWPTVVNMCFNPIPKERDSLRSRSKEGFHASWLPRQRIVGQMPCHLSFRNVRWSMMFDVLSPLVCTEIFIWSSCLRHFARERHLLGWLSDFHSPPSICPWSILYAGRPGSRKHRRYTHSVDLAIRQWSFWFPVNLGGSFYVLFLLFIWITETGVSHWCTCMFFFLAKVNSLRRVMVSRGEENLPTDIDEVEEAESEWKTWGNIASQHVFIWKI